MSVFKRGRVWWYDVGHGPTRIRKSAGRDATKQEALQLAAATRTYIRKALIRQRLGDPARHQFDDALLRWIQGGVKALKSRRKTSNHASVVMGFSAGRWLDEGPEIAQDIIAAGLAKGLRPATINQRLAVVRRVLNLAYRWGWLETPLGKRVTLLRPDNERHVYLTPAQVHRLASEAGTARDAVLLLAYTGLRLSELWSLTPEHVVDGCIVLEATNKSGRPRVIPIPEAVAHCPIPPAVTRAVFRSRFEAARAALGRPDLHAHDLRHSYASMLINAGAEATDVRDLLGHANLAVTSRYAHLYTGRLKGVVAKLRHNSRHSQDEGGNGTDG